jgi:hexokinase
LETSTTSKAKEELQVKEIKQKVADFLKKHHLYYADIDSDEVLKLLIQEMENGLKGKKSSLQMIPTYIQAKTKIPVQKPVVVLDAGGTHLRVARIHFDETLTPHIDQFGQHPMPGTKGGVTKEQFFSQLAEHIKGISDCSDRIGFCFSYPTEILPSKDGRLLFFTKEIETTGLIGELIGEGLLQALGKSGKDNRKNIVILNDTVATLVAAQAKSSQRMYGGYLGFILGTGLNICYIEKNTRITKTKNLDASQNQIINIEMGSFDKCPRGDIDLKIDAATENPGLGVLEKMISGAYFGQVCLQVIQTARQEGLFSPEAGKKLGSLTSLSSKEVSEYLEAPYGSNTLAQALSTQTQEDHSTLYYLTDFMVERSAKLVALIIAGSIAKNPPLENPCAPVCISAEGSTFFKLHELKSRAECYLRHLLIEKYNQYFEFVKIENAPLIGAAIAGLTN